MTECFCRPLLSCMLLGGALQVSDVRDIIQVRPISPLPGVERVIVICIEDIMNQLLSGSLPLPDRVAEVRKRSHLNSDIVTAVHLSWVNQLRESESQSHSQSCGWAAGAVPRYRRNSAERHAGIERPQHPCPIHTTFPQPPSCICKLSYTSLLCCKPGRPWFFLTPTPVS